METNGTYLTVEVTRLIKNSGVNGMQIILIGIAGLLVRLSFAFAGWHIAKTITEIILK
jgi:hypothetical protein